MACLLLSSLLRTTQAWRRVVQYRRFAGGLQKIRRVLRPEDCVVVIRMPDGSIQDFHLRCVSQSLRLVRPCASYELAMMVANGRWEIVGVRTEAAKRLLRRAGFLPAAFARRQRWRTSLLASMTRVPTNATGWEFSYANRRSFFAVGRSFPAHDDDRKC